MMTERVRAVRSFPEINRTTVVFLMFGFLFFASNILSYLAHNTFGKTESLVVAIALSGLYVLFLVLCNRFVACRNSVAGVRSPFPSRKLFTACFVLFELEFVVVLLANYPGFCTNDSNDIINQVLGTSSWSTWHRYDGLSNHHPVFYTFCVCIVFKITAFANSVEFSTFAFCFLQSTVVAIGLSWSLNWLNRKKAPKLMVIAALLFFLLTPVVSAHAPIIWKDVPFSILVLALSLCLFDLSSGDYGSSKQIAVKIFFLLVAITLVRNNGLYVSLIIMLAIFAMIKGFRKLVIAMASGILVLTLVVQGPLFSALSVEKSHFSESVAIPIQQIAYVIASDGKITDRQEAFLSEILPMEEWGSLYKETSPNKIKFSPDFNDTFLESHKMDFLLVWAQMMPTNFFKYVKAWALETEGYWHFGYYGRIGTLSSLYKSDPQSIVGIHLHPSEIAAELSKPLSPILCMGSIVWVVLTAFALALAKRGPSKRLLCFMPALALLFTLYIAAPIASDFRYVLPLFLLIPFLPVLMFGNERADADLPVKEGSSLCLEGEVVKGA